MASSGKYTSKLRDVRVLIIGGTSGIGFAVAEAILDHGGSVIVSSSSHQRVTDAIERLEAAFPSAQGRVTGYTCNLNDVTTVDSEVEKLFSQVADGGKLDHVVHTAGDALKVAPLESFSAADIQQVGMVRFISPLIVAKNAAKLLRKSPESSITLTTGAGAERPSPNWTVIASYLAGLQGMCRGLAVDLAPLRVNLVSPGAVDTELWDSFRNSGTFDQLKAKVEAGMATKTIGKVEDVAESYLYLMKDKNVTGTMIGTNGGALIVLANLMLGLDGFQTTGVGIQVPEAQQHCETVSIFVKGHLRIGRLIGQPDTEKAQD